MLAANSRGAPQVLFLEQEQASCRQMGVRFRVVEDASAAPDRKLFSLGNRGAIALNTVQVVISEVCIRLVAEYHHHGEGEYLQT